MRHADARRIIPLIVGTGICDRRAHALFLITRLTESRRVDQAWVDRMLTRCCQLPNTRVQPEADLEAIHAADSERDFVAWAGRLITQRPESVASQLVALWCTHACWHHASRDERWALQKAWWRFHQSCKAPPGSWASLEDLEDWHRHCPTLCGDEALDVEYLSRILDEEAPDRVQHGLACLLGPTVHLQTLCRILGGLAQQTLLHRFDLRNQQRQGSLACVAAEELCPLLPPADLVVLISQLCHEIWWYHQRDRRPLEPASNSGDDDDLEEIIASGDYRAAQRAARRACPRPERLWGLAFERLDTWSSDGQGPWPRLLEAMVVSRHRSGSDGQAPDDAAVLAATLAAVSWLQQQPTAAV